MVERVLVSLEALVDENWFSAVLVFILLFSMMFGIYATWGILFIYWVVPALRNGEVFLVKNLGREQEPYLFWLVCGMWVLGGFHMLMLDVIRVVDHYYPNASYTFFHGIISGVKSAIF